MSCKEQSSGTGQSSERDLLTDRGRRRRKPGRRRREQRLKWSQEKEEQKKEPLKKRWDTQRCAVGRDKLRGCGYCSASWWWICTCSSQLVMGACEPSEHDSVLRGHTEATHKQHGTWSQRTPLIQTDIHHLTHFWPYQQLHVVSVSEKEK